MEDITCTDLKERLEKGEKVNLIDVREHWEFDEDNLGGMLFPMGEIALRLEELEDLKNAEIITHCRTGARSGQVKLYLLNNGFSNVRNLIGGIEAYRAL